MYNYYPLSCSAKINLYPVELVEVEQIVIDRELGSGEMMMESINNWSKALGGKLTSALKLAGLEKDSHQIVFNNDGLMGKFASLKTIEDIELFSKKYGLLGIQSPESAQVNSQSPAIRATLQPAYIFNNYGFSLLEPIELWMWHIAEVRKILRLYDVVKKNSSDDQINEIIEVKLHRGKFGSLDEDREITDRYFIHWAIGEPILLLPEFFEEKTMLEIARYTLAKILESHLSGGINIGIGELISDPSTKVFKITEQRYSKYLVAAVYYDLWQKINDSRNIQLCDNERCRLPLLKSGRKKYCNDACKQEAYRIRLEKKEMEGKNL
ncbi:hypothetical protein [Priestia aryabhattai]|uniref:hypothetical protein n=1 Tax=Priestia aryabhattai TaxID=412384 RepID=UPI003CECAF71